MLSLRSKCYCFSHSRASGIQFDPDIRSFSHSRASRIQFGPDIWSLSINVRFFDRKYKNQQKLAKNYSFYNTFSLEKPHSFYEPQHYKKYTPATLPKT